jgi:excisionase family DNA binding protein
MTPKWLSTPQVAEELGVTLATVYRLINNGELLAHRIGRVIRVRGEDLDAYLCRTRVSPGGLDHLVAASVRTDDAG